MDPYKNVADERKLKYFNEWDNEMRSLNVWVDILWLTLAANVTAKMLNTSLRICSPRWKKTGPTTKCIDPIKPIDVYDVPLFSNVVGPTNPVGTTTRAKLSYCYPSEQKQQTGNTLQPTGNIWP